MTQECGGGGGVVRTKYCHRGGWNAAAVKQCDLCRSAAALLFCHADSAFMCITCDSKVHNNNNARVWMCQVCEQAPAAYTCKADAASLCVTCDRDIHSANPLARRHHRIAVVPFYTATVFDVPVNDQGRKCIPADDQWTFLEPIVTSKIETPGLKSMEYLFSGSDDHRILEFDSYQISSSQPCGDSVVPVQTNVQPPVPLPEKEFDQFDFGKSNFGSYLNGYTTTQTLSHSVSTSSMDVGVVPDGSAMSETSYPFSRNMSSSVDLVGSRCSPAVGTDREARVLRYKEKRKNRKFEKTIRYASRKAYAEVRPRIKGRFAKRTDVDQSNVVGIYGATVTADYIADARYGVVPSL